MAWKTCGPTMWLVLESGHSAILELPQQTGEASFSCPAAPTGLTLFRQSPS